MELNVTSIPTETNWMTGGINFDLPGNGGVECRDHVTLEHRIIETLFGSALALIALIVGIRLQPCRNMKKISTTFSSHNNQGFNEATRIFLLISFSFIYGLEVSYKLSTRQLVFLLNPCHVISLLEIYLLAALPYADPDRVSTSTVVFRSVLHWFHGPLVALFFPVTNTRVLPFECETYWIQHILLVVVPIYLILCTRQYSTHEPFDLSALLVSYGLWGLYHWCVMQPVSVWTLANIGNMLCPAISDPFYGDNYRLHAVWHQFMCTVVMGTFCGLVAKVGAAGRRALNGEEEKKEN